MGHRSIHLLAQRADLKHADVKRSNLKRAEVQRTDLKRADVKRADVKRADVKRTDVRLAYVLADVEGAKKKGANVIVPNYYPRPPRSRTTDSFQASAGLLVIFLRLYI
ncbi:MAG: pentapeptide repeat-containing protein [Burkholderiales bacterium]|nr:pentapeptide repeat-containing protein [Burkholderiales bacterium]